MAEGVLGIVIFSVFSVEEPKRRQNQLTGVELRALEETAEEGCTESGKESETSVSEDRDVKGK